MITSLINHLPGSFAYLFGLENVCRGVLFRVYFDGPLAILGSELMNISGELEFNNLIVGTQFFYPFSCQIR